MGADVMVRNAWYVAGLSHEFAPMQLVGQVVAGRPIVLWRTGTGAMAAFDDRCVHKRMPLSRGRLLTDGLLADGLLADGLLADGLLADGLLECAYHGLCYDVSGACVRVPAHPDGHIPRGAQLRPIPLAEQDGMVWVWPGDPTKSSTVSPPRVPEMTSVDWDTRDVGGAMAVPANSLLLIENLLDITHFYPLHDGNIGDIENSRIPIKVEEGTGPEGNRFVGTVREAEDYAQPPYLAEYLGYDRVDRHHTHFLLNPGLTRVQMRVWPAGRRGDPDVERGYVIIHTHTPVDRRNHVWRLIINMPKGQMCRSDPGRPAIEHFVETFPKVIAEDRWALEAQQRMFDYPDDGYAEVFLRPDTALRRARLLLSRLERAERPDQEVAGARAAE